jgi:dTDP-4-amino-4,6-dideoxygalactose transaminase
MSEFHAVLAKGSLDGLDDRIDRRNELAEAYVESFADVPGVSFPSIEDGDRSTFKDLTVFVEADDFGLNADELSSTLGALGIETRRYYSPPVHEMEAYRGTKNGSGDLTVTQWAARRVLSLPMWSEMSVDVPSRVASAVRRIRRRVVGSHSSSSAVR